MKPVRLALLCDYREEGWHSMDLFGDMLYEQLSSHYRSDFAVEQFRPPFRRLFSRIPIVGGRHAFWNADRLRNRFQTYPACLRRQASRYDLFHLIDHSYGQLGFEIAPERMVVQVHDLDTFRCLLDPQQEPRPGWFRAMVQRTLDGIRRAAHVVTISESTREQILRHGLVPPARVSVSYLGVHPAFSAEPDPQSERVIEELLGPVAPDRVDVLHVGSCIPRKRIDVLLRVFARIKKQFPNARLVRVGGRLTAAQEELVDRLQIRAAIHSMPFLSNKVLAALYRRATVLLTTSEAEGFGLPVPEAMSCACPVIASDIPALREAAGSAARYCRVADVEAWAATAIELITSFHENPELRSQMTAQGLSYAARFSWAETAAGSVAAYRKLLAA